LVRDQNPLHQDKWYYFKNFRGVREGEGRTARDGKREGRWTNSSIWGKPLHQKGGGRKTRGGRVGSSPFKRIAGEKAKGNLQEKRERCVWGGGRAANF